MHDVLLLFPWIASSIVIVSLRQQVNLSPDSYATPRYDGAVVSADVQHSGEELRPGIPFFLGFESNGGRRNECAADAHAC